MNEHIERLKLAVPHLIGGIQEAKQKGKPIFVIAYENPKGGGQMILTIDEPEQLLKDIATLINVPYEKPKDYDVRKFLSIFGIK